MSVEVASKRLSNLGEGPHWDRLTQKLYYVDAFVGDICQLDTTTGETEAVTFDGTVTLVVPYQNQPHNLLITKGKEVRKLNWNTKESKVVSIVDPENPKTRFNDGKCDPRGRLWTGTLIEGQAEGGSLYSLDSSYKFTKFADKITVSNGLTWTLDYRTLFYIDSEARRIYEFDFDLEAGTASNQRVLVDYNVDDGYADLGVPDGMTIDIEGKLWVACFGGGCVIRVDPKTKKILQKVDIPATKTTSCCFGGPHYDILYVTTAWMGLSEEDRKDEPQAGAVFAVKNLPVRGQNAYDFIEAPTGTKQV